MEIVEKDEIYNVYKIVKGKKDLIFEKVSHTEVEDYIVEEVSKYLNEFLPKQARLNSNTARSCKQELQNIKSLHKYRQDMGKFSIIVLAANHD